MPAVTLNLSWPAMSQTMRNTILFVCLFVPNEYKSNRSSIKSQDLSILFMSAQYTHSVAICHEEIQFTCFPGLLHNNYSHIQAAVCQRETLRCPLA